MAAAKLPRFTSPTRAMATWRKEEVPQRDSLLDEFTEFIESLERGDDDTPIPQVHGLNVLKVLEATEESARTGREVVLDME